MFRFLSAPPIKTDRPARIGLFLFFCAGFADGEMVPFFPLWARSQAGIPVGYIGLLFACYASGELLATPFLGGIADRVGRRPVLIISICGVGVGFLALYLAHGIVAAAAILVATGVFESVLHPTISTVIADATPAQTHQRQFSLVKVSSNAGRVLGPATGALLALFSLKWVFVAGGAVLLAGGLITLLCLPETIGWGAAADDEDDEEDLASLLPAFRDRRLAVLLLWFLLLEVSGSWVEAVLPLYAHDTGILTPSGVGLLFTYAAALIVGAQMLVSRIAAGRSALWLTLSAGAMFVIAFGILIVAPGLVGLIAAVGLFSMAEMLIGPLVPTAVNELAPPGRRATYMAATSVANDLKDSLGPATGTALYALSARLPWIAAIPIAGIAAIGLGISLLRKGQPSPSRPSPAPPLPVDR
jgi:DHA1 family tetracycline resistance protein-like MFS transporter